MSGNVHHIENMTSPEISAVIQSGLKRVIVPCGAIEQHGPHLELRMDADHAEALAPLVASGIGGALVAPTITVGCSKHHLPFSGTISLAESTFAAICKDYCTSLAKHGIEEIFFFSGHVGNFPVLERYLPELRAAAPQCKIEAFTDSTVWLQTWSTAVSIAGGASDRVGGHADIAETSIMLTIKPQAVRQSAIQVGRIGLMSKAELEAMWHEGLPSVSPNGILGDARGANKTVGEECLRAISLLLINDFKSKA